MANTAKQPLLTIFNQHVGDEPEAFQTEGKFLSYFEGAFGDQWVFIGDRSNKTAILTGGDIDWEQHTMSEGKLLPRVILGSEETLWLISCQKSFFGKSFRGSKQVTQQAA